MAKEPPIIDMKLVPDPENPGESVAVDLKPDWRTRLRAGAANAATAVALFDPKDYISDKLKKMKRKPDRYEGKIIDPTGEIVPENETTAFEDRSPSLGRKIAEAFKRGYEGDTPLMRRLQEVRDKRYARLMGKGTQDKEPPGGTAR